MALTIEDLQPKDFIIEINGVKVTCKPPRMSHTLIISKVGEIFSNIKDSDREDVMQAEKDFDWVVSELTPELKDIKLDMQSSLEFITQIMEKIQPEENKELAEKGVKFDTDPKAEKIG